MSQASAKISPPEEPESDVIARAHSGDRDAFAALYNQHRDTVYVSIVRRVRNRDLAEDLTQEVFVRALRRMETFAWQGKGLGPWLQTIARNLIIDHYRSSRVRLEVPSGDFFESGKLGCNAEDVALGVLRAVEARKVIDYALPLLSAHQRTCIRLRFLEELSVPETARVMGRQPGAVKTLQYRALRSLMRIVQPTEEVAA
ncbi:RNA polymerase sigma factor [Streptomyces dysideae]|uniref:RNA polymerase sigma factor n=1 Tax=Streptomyces dysideae TaxID=909626 RepID=UPI000A668A94|nr:RNA polymerase sigma factor [Streptomyces dysideae]